jgi:hypothetical protein
METSLFSGWKKLRSHIQQNASKKFQSHSMDRHRSLSFKMWPLCIVLQTIPTIAVMACLNRTVQRLFSSQQERDD